MRTYLLTAIFVSTVIFSQAAVADPFDECILQHMGTARDQAAVYSIERACISKTSVAIPYDPDFEGALSANVGSFNTGSGASINYGLVITLKNTTKFNITSLKVIIRDKLTKKDSEYFVEEFSGPFPPGFIITGLGEPSRLQIIKIGETRDFFVHIGEFVRTPAEFGKKFDWAVMPMRDISVN